MPGANICAANLSRWQMGAILASQKAMDNFGERAVEYAKQNHPWENDTGLAEEGLNHTTIPHGWTAIETLVAHGVEWGVYLETREAFCGRYKILDQAVQTELPKLMSDLRDIFGYNILNVRVTSAG